jgi:tetratricopeptide (TPR) repeat protein
MSHRLLPFILFLLASACTVYREYPIEVYEPAEVTVPSAAGSAALIYRNFKYHEDTLRHYFKSDYQLFRAKNDPKNLDSMLVTACLNKLAASLREKKTFQDVQIFPYHAFKRHTGDHLPEMPPALIEQIAGATRADVLISLETYSSFFSAWSQTYDTPRSNEVVTVAVWGMYDPVKKVRTEIKTLIDTVYWNGYDDEGNEQQNYSYPPRLSALELASALAGENYARRFDGSWNTVSRMYSIPPLPDFSDAAFFFEEGKWEQAITLWQKYADQRNGKMAIDARYNLALAYEMKDDLPTAKKWLDLAYNLAEKYHSKTYIRMIATYQKVLENRSKRQ